MGTKTYLSYANDLLAPFGESEISSSDWSNLKGPHLVAKNAVVRAVDIIMSRERKWPFNRQAGSQELTVGQVEYSWPSAFRAVDMNSFYIEKDDTLNINTKHLEETTREDWVRYHMEDDLNNTTLGRNVPDFVFKSVGNFGVTPAPNAAYTVKFIYFDIPTRMTAYDDTTTVPDEFQHVVINYGMIFMNRFYENDEQMAEIKQEAKASLQDMRSTLINDEFVMKDRRVARG